MKLSFTDQLNQNPFYNWWVSLHTRATLILHPPQLYPVTQLPTSLCVSHPCFTQLSQPCLPSDTRPFPLSSPLNKYVLWSPSQNTLAYTHAHSQSAPWLDTDPEDSKGAVKVAGGTVHPYSYRAVMVQLTLEKEKEKRLREREKETYLMPFSV